MSDDSTSSPVIGLKLSDGSLETLSEGTLKMSVESDRIDTVIIPTSVPWKDSIQLFPAPLVFAGSEEGSMGPKTT